MPRTRGHVTGIRPPFQQDFPLRGLQQLRHDLRVIPRSAARPEGKQHYLAAWQDLRPMALFSIGGVHRN